MTCDQAMVKAIQAARKSAPGWTGLSPIEQWERCFPHLSDAHLEQITEEYSAVVADAARAALKARQGERWWT